MENKYCVTTKRTVFLSHYIPQDRFNNWIGINVINSTSEENVYLDRRDIKMFLVRHNMLY